MADLPVGEEVVFPSAAHWRLILSNPDPLVESRQHLKGRPSLSEPVAVAITAARELKFRQAAFVYLHVSVLYEAAAYEMWRAGLLPFTRLGAPALWLVIGGVVALGVFFVLLYWRNVWFVRVIWGLHALRLPPLIAGAFFPGTGRPIPPAFYITAIVVVVINLWMLARAGWDL
jgi:hypothetical protein